MEKAFLFETILFYHEAPCYYQVFASERGFIWTPIAHHFYRNINFPTFEARLEKDQWVVDGDTDQHLKLEIVSEMRKNIKRTVSPAMPVLI